MFAADNPEPWSSIENKSVSFEDNCKLKHTSLESRLCRIAFESKLCKICPKRIGSVNMNLLNKMGSRFNFNFIFLLDASNK